MAKKAGARYLDSPVQKKSIRGRLGTILASSAALVAIVGTMLLGGMVAGAAASDKPTLTAAEAVGPNLCGVIGMEMDSRHGWKAGWDVALPELDNRRFMLSEVVPNSIWWSNFSGTATDLEGEWLISAWDDEVAAANRGRPDAAKLPETSQLPSELQDFRNNNQCTFNAIGGVLGGLGLNFANFISKITSFVTTTAFNSSFICDVDLPRGGGGNCIDLVGILGGRGNDAAEGGTGQGGNSGVIGNLTSGLYQPLIFIVLLATAAVVFHTGIVKRKFREAFGQALWLAASFIIGLALLLNPSMLVKAPMVAGNTILGCIVGAFNDSGCTGGGGGDSNAPGTPTTAKENVCAVDATTTRLEQKTTLYISSLGCSIWSSFVLEPYAQGAYGVSLSSLDLDSVIDGSSDQTVRSLLEGPGYNPGGVDSTDPGNPNAICVNLKTNSSYDDMGTTFRGRAETGSGAQGAVCNLAVWDLFMKTQAVGGVVTSANISPDNKWFTVMSRLPANEELFSSYTNEAGSWGKFGMGSIAWIAALLSGAMLIAVSISALVYYLIAIIMVAFAPVFFLIGMHPTRGKKLMLGWLEQIISNLLKYLVSAVFVLIAITFFGAILGTATDFLTSLLFIILINAALLMYRKELIGLLGRVDMGGEKITNLADNMMDRGQKSMDWTGKKGKALAAGAVAGVATGAGLKTGLKAATLRELRQGNTFLGRTFQAADAISNDNENDLYKIEKAKRGEAESRKKQADEAEGVATRAAEDMKPTTEEIKQKKEALDELVQKERDLSVESSLRTEVAGEFDVFLRESDWGKLHSGLEADGDQPSTRDAYSQLANTQRELRQVSDLEAKQLEKGDTEAAKLTSERKVTLQGKLESELNDFRAVHGARGALEGVQEMTEKREELEALKVRERAATADGDVELAKDLAGQQRKLAVELNAQRQDFDFIYGPSMHKTATEKVNESKKDFVAAGETEEDQASRRSYFSKSDAQHQIDREMIGDRANEVREELAVSQDRLEEQARKLDELLGDASKLRSDASLLEEETKAISQARQDLTPGDILTRQKMKGIQDDALLNAGARGAKEAEFGANLKKALAEVSDVTNETVDPNYTISKELKDKGDIVLGLERDHGKKLDEFALAAARSSAQEREKELARLEDEALKLGNQLMASKREEAGKLGGKDLLSPKAYANLGRNMVAKAREKASAEAAGQLKLADDLLKDAEKQAAVFGDGRELTSEQIPEFEQAKEVLEKAKARRREAEEIFEHKSMLAKDARESFEQNRRTLDAEVAREAAAAARAAADSAGSRFEEIKVSETFNQNKNVPAAQKAEIERIEKFAQSAAELANRDVLDTATKARLKELEEQLGALTGPLNEQQLKNLKKLRSDIYEAAAAPRVTEVIKANLPGARATEPKRVEPKPQEPDFIDSPRETEQRPAEQGSQQSKSGGLGAAVQALRGKREAGGSAAPGLPKTPLAPNSGRGNIEDIVPDGGRPQRRLDDSNE